MKFLKRPTLEFEQIEITEGMGWIAGQHRWLPAVLKFDSLEEYAQFYENTPSEINEIQFDGIKIIEGDAQELIITFSYDHARIHI